MQGTYGGTDPTNNFSVIWSHWSNSIGATFSNTVRMETTYKPTKMASRYQNFLFFYKTVRWRTQYTRKKTGIDKSTLIPDRWQCLAIYKKLQENFIFLLGFKKNLSKKIIHTKFGWPLTLLKHHENRHQSSQILERKRPKWMFSFMDGRKRK